MSIFTRTRRRRRRKEASKIGNRLPVERSVAGNFDSLHYSNRPYLSHKFTQLFNYHSLLVKALIVASIFLVNNSIALTYADSVNSQSIVNSVANAFANGAIVPSYGAPNSNNAGVITIANQNRNQYLLNYVHDPKTNLSSFNIVPVNHPNLHEPRIDLRYASRNPYVNLDERSPNNTVLAAVLVDDPDTGPSGETSLSIEQGNELNHFKLVSTGISNTIQVNGAPLSKQKVPEYNLLIVAQDHGSPPKSSNITLVIKLTTLAASPPAITAPLDSKPPVTDLMYVGAMLVVVFSALIFLIIIGCALVQRPRSKKGPPPRSTSATNSRMHPSDQCLCLNLTSLPQYDRSDITH